MRERFSGVGEGPRVILGGDQGRYVMAELLGIAALASREKISPISFSSFLPSL